MKMKIEDLIPALAEFDVLGMIDLSEVSSSHHVVYLFFRDLYKSVYEHKERMVLYSKYRPNFDLLLHIQKTLNVYDISNSFVLLVCPGDIRHDLDTVRHNHSTDDWPMHHLDIEIEDAGKLKSDFSLSTTMCPLPWTQLKVRANGDMLPCCVYRDQLKDDKGQMININTHTISEFYHSNALDRIRQDLSSGIQHKGCHACWHAEKMNFNSTRKLAFSVQGKEFYPMDLSTTSTENFIALDLEMGNLCNLKCNICNWQRSSQIAAEEIKKNPSLAVKIKQFNQQTKWINDTTTLEKLVKINDNIRFLEFEGGEPLLHVYHKELLEHFIHKKKSSSIRLRYSTNGTIFPSHLMDLWKHFKEVNICLSIDDIGKRFEYQRANAVWSQVEKNLKSFKNCDIIQVQTSVFVTVNLQNVFYIPELLEYFRAYGWNVVLSFLSAPNELCIESMTLKAKEIILEKLSESAMQFSILHSLISAIKDIKPTDGSAFTKFITELDNQRPTNFVDSHFEIADAMGYNP